MKKDWLHFEQPNDGGDVYELVQGLSTVERRGLRTNWNRATGKSYPQYMQLFDEIVAGRATDDTTARLAMGAIRPTQLSNLKQQLLNEILEQLVSAHHDATPLFQLHTGLMQLRELEERCCWQLARRLSKKLWAIAEQHGSYIFALELLFRRSQLIVQSNYQHYDAEAKAVNSLIEEYASYRRITQQIRYYAEKLLLLKTSDRYLLVANNRKEVEEAAATLQSLSVDGEAVPHLRFRYLACYALCQHLLRQYKQCGKLIAEGLSLLQARPDMVVQEVEPLLSLVSTACYNGFAVDDVAEVEHFLDSFNKLAKHGPTDARFQKRWAILLFHNHLKIAHGKADYDSVARLLNEEAQTILGYVANAAPPLESLSVLTSIVISLFVLERFDEAEALLLVVKERNRRLDRDDIFYFSLIFHLVILFELKEWRRLASACEAAYQSIYKRKQQRPLEKDLMGFLKSLAVHRGQEEMEALTRAFLPRLEAYLNHPKQKLFFIIFDYYNWLQSKLARVSYRDYKRQLLISQKSHHS